MLDIFSNSIIVHFRILHSASADTVFNVVTSFFPRRILDKTVWSNPNLSQIVFCLIFITPFLLVHTGEMAFMSIKNCKYTNNNTNQKQLDKSKTIYLKGGKKMNLLAVQTFDNTIYMNIDKNDYIDPIIVAIARQNVAKKEMAASIGVDPGHFSTMLKVKVHKMKLGKGRTTAGGRGADSWTIDRYMAALEYLGIDPCEALGISPFGGGAETAQITHILNGLGDKDIMLEIIRKISDIASEYGIERVVQTLDVVHGTISKKSPAVPNKKR